MIWFILFIILTVTITAMIGHIEGYWDAGDYILIGMLIALCVGIVLFLMGCIVEGLILPSAANETVVEYHREELVCNRDDGLYVINCGDDKYQYTIYEETKGYIEKEITHSQVYFLEVELGDTPHLSAYKMDWGSDKLNLLFTNGFSHYTFYIPETP